MSNKPSHYRRPKPPRFSKTAADILGYMPSYIPTSQLAYQSAIALPQTYEGCPQWAQKAAEAYIPDSPLGAAETTMGLPRTLCRFPQTILESDDRLLHLPPIGRRREPSEAQTKFPQTKLSGYHLSPPSLPSPTTYTFPYNTATQSSKVVHPTPYRPIRLPDVQDPLLHPGSLEKSSYLPTPVASTLPRPLLDAPDYSYSTESTVHKDSRKFLLQKAAAAVSYRSYCSPLTERTSKCGCNSVGVPIRASEPGAFDLDDYAEFLRQRFSCSISHKWLEGVVRPDSHYVHPNLLTESEKALYQTRVRSWIAGNTGLTIHEEVYQAFVAIDARDGQQCTIPLIWFVFLLREVLVMSPCAQQLGILRYLGAQDLDPCHPFFRFSALKDAVGEFLGSMNAKSTSRDFYDVVGTQQYITDVCSEGHLHIVMSQTPYSTLHPQPLRPRPYLRPDMVSYTNEFRENIKKMFADASAVEYIFLARILRPRSDDLRDWPQPWSQKKSQRNASYAVPDYYYYERSLQTPHYLKFHPNDIAKTLTISLASSDELFTRYSLNLDSFWKNLAMDNMQTDYSLLMFWTSTGASFLCTACRTTACTISRESYSIKLLGSNNDTEIVLASTTHTIANDTKGTFEDLDLRQPAFLLGRARFRCRNLPQYNRTSELHHTGAKTLGGSSATLHPVYRVQREVFAISNGSIEKFESGGDVERWLSQAPTAESSDGMVSGSHYLKPRSPYDRKESRAAKEYFGE
ncbi:hypothetical protein P691DRAFT_782667 [Macrolepiota fuliginosa MF-IS2]|uniref:Uncharacterized protein n=1 Tax=Macrolepiota fuliginosa MF-IS2 TaxID=1400762 RepID=A0A9P5XNE5_9AGAR|nr:hypothetical protein P691DRAFT_782667 [Macrolepiota fuliginosa MF-IS2]